MDKNKNIESGELKEKTFTKGAEEGNSSDRKRI